MQDLGFAAPQHIIQELSPANFGYFVERAEAPREDGVGFIGDLRYRSDSYPHADLRNLADRTLQTWLVF